MNDFPPPAVAASLWTFGRETPVDGDKLAFNLMWERWLLPQPTVSDHQYRSQT